MSDKVSTGLADFSDTTSDIGRTEFIVRQVMNRMATATLVLVKAVDADARTVDVQPMVAQIDGAGKAVPHGTINKLPYFELRGGNSAVLLTPVVGDIGLAVFCHSDTSSVRKNRKPSNPGSRRRFDWADGVYLGGLLGMAPTQSIALDDAGITITAAAGKKVTIVSDTETRITGPVRVTGAATFDGEVTIGGLAFSTHKHNGVATGAAKSGGPVAP